MIELRREADRQDIVRREDGSLWDRAAMSSFMRDMQRRHRPEPRLPMVRLSESDPMCQSIDAELKARSGR